MVAKCQYLSWEEYRSIAGFRLESRDWMFSKIYSCGWGKRTDFMYAYPMPKNAMFSNEGHCFFPHDSSQVWGYIGYLNSAIGQSLVNLITGQHKLAGYVGNIPVADKTLLSKLGNIAKEIYQLSIKYNYHHENSYEFNINRLQNRSLEEFQLDIDNFSINYQALIKKLDEVSFETVGTDGTFERENGYCRSNLPDIVSCLDRNVTGRACSILLGIINRPVF